jgi:hypothetical protein
MHSIMWPIGVGDCLAEFMVRPWRTATTALVLASHSTIAVTGLTNLFSTTNFNMPSALTIHAIRVAAHTPTKKIDLRTHRSGVDPQKSFIQWRSDGSIRMPHPRGKWPRSPRLSVRCKCSDCHQKNGSDNHCQFHFSLSRAKLFYQPKIDFKQVALSMAGPQSRASRINLSCACTRHQRPIGRRFSPHPGSRRGDSRVLPGAASSRASSASRSPFEGCSGRNPIDSGATTSNQSQPEAARKTELKNAVGWDVSLFATAENSSMKLVKHEGRMTLVRPAANCPPLFLTANQFCELSCFLGAGRGSSPLHRSSPSRCSPAPPP